MADWDKNKRIKLTIDHTKVDGTLTDFPVLVNMTNNSAINNYDYSAVFNELVSSSNRKKIAFVYPSVQEHSVLTSSGTTETKTYIHGSNEELYCEIERWDQTNKEAQLWVKIPKVLGDQPTDFFMYYDSNQDDNVNYIGDTGEVAGQKVWDDDYSFVAHMSQDPSATAPQILDSTSNSNNGTSHGSMTSNDIVNGPVGKAVEFDGSDDYIDVPATAALLDSADFTIEVVIKSTDVTVNNYISKYYSSNTDLALTTGIIGSSSKPTVAFYNDDLIGSTTLSNNTWYTIQSTFLTSTKAREIFLNGNSDGTDTSSGQLSSTNSKDLYISRFGTAYAPCTVAGLKISKVVRSDSWLKATYYSNYDDILTATSGTLYQIGGYVKQYNTPAQRTVYLYDRYSGDLMDKTVSDTNGYYTLQTTSSGLHDIVCLDADESPDFDDMIISKVYPSEVV